MAVLDVVAVFAVHHPLLGFVHITRSWNIEVIKKDDVVLMQ